MRSGIHDHSRRDSCAVRGHGFRARPPSPCGLRQTPRNDGRDFVTRPAPSTVRWLILVALLVFWELMPRTQIIPELFLPSLSKTVTVLIRDWHEYASELMVT